jgi:hypothetical protein
MPRPPNYKQDKQRREDAKRKKNQQAQAERAARKSVPAGEGGGDASQTPGKPQG